MYHVTSKTVVDGKRSVLTSCNGREEARAKAREMGGTVRTQAEFDDMVAAGEIEMVVAEDLRTEEQVAADKAITESLTEEQVEAETQQQVEEEQAKHAVKTERQQAIDEQAEADAAEESPIVAAARRVAAAPKVKRTVGAAKAAPKRTQTSAEDMERVAKELREYAKGNPTKVQIVRWLAAWEGNKLNRRDVFAIIKGFIVDLGIADATISTQFQLVRAGKAPAAK